MIPGDYVLIQVTDTGSGMDTETLRHLFEPFFTTKELGKGTGLGLSIVYGIVKQTEGFIFVESAPGRGSTFRVYLPRVTGEADRAVGSPVKERAGTETILLVEDEDEVRELIRQSLSDQGYRMLEARNGAEALTICTQHRDRIQLLLTDIVLPGIRGGKVAEVFRTTNRGGRIIYMTGYTDTRGFAELAAKEKSTIIQKPFSLAALGELIRRVLDDPGAQGAPTG